MSTILNCGTINNAGSQKPLFECHGHIFMDGEDFRAARERHSGRPDEAYVRQALALLQAENCVYFRDGGDNLGVSLLARELAPERVASRIILLRKSFSPASSSATHSFGTFGAGELPTSANFKP